MKWKGLINWLWIPIFALNVCWTINIQKSSKNIQKSSNKLDKISQTAIEVQEEQTIIYQEQNKRKSINNSRMNEINRLLELIDEHSKSYPQLQARIAQAYTIWAEELILPYFGQMIFSLPEWETKRAEYFYRQAIEFKRNGDYYQNLAGFLNLQGKTGTADSLGIIADSLSADP